MVPQQYKTDLLLVSLMFLTDFRGFLAVVLSSVIVDLCHLTLVAFSAALQPYQFLWA